MSRGDAIVSEIAALSSGAGQDERTKTPTLYPSYEI